MAIHPSENETNEADIFKLSHIQIIRCLFSRLTIQNYKHFVIGHKDPIRYLETAYYFDTVRYTNRRQLSRKMNMRI